MSARIEGWRGVSPLCATALAQIIQSFISQRVQPATCRVLHHLAIPGRSVELGKPGAEPLQFDARQPPHRILNFFDRAHTAKLTLSRSPAQPKVRNYDGSWTEWGNLIDAPIAKGVA
jgi:hypothetical protein